MSTSLLSNGRYTIALSEHGQDATLAHRLRAFLHPYFTSVAPAALTTALSATDPGDSIDLHLTLHDADAFESTWIDACTLPLTIRDTTAIGFTLRVLTTPPGDAKSAADSAAKSAEKSAKNAAVIFADDRVSPQPWYAWDPVLHVGYRIDRGQRRVDFYGNPNAFIHLIELVRYYGLLVEQAKGTAIMHASAVMSRDGGDVIAIGGIKGAGKTTTMLDLVLSGDYLYFSGDKLLLDVVDGKVRARGWPDYPHVGLGTLRSHPALADRLGFSALVTDPTIADTEKRLCAPEAMRAALDGADIGVGWLSTVMLPNVSVPGAMRTLALEPTGIADAIQMDGLFEWPHRFITSTWHGLLDATHAGLSDTVPAELVNALADVAWQSRLGLPRQYLAA